MAPRHNIRTTDLGQGWFANENNDGSMTIRNCDKGQRIELELESVEKLRSIFPAVRRGDRLMAVRHCARCGVSEKHEILALSNGKLVCQDCDSALEHEWVGEDPEHRRHSLDTFSPLD